MPYYLCKIFGIYMWYSLCYIYDICDTAFNQKFGQWGYKFLIDKPNRNLYRIIGYCYLIHSSTLKNICLWYFNVFSLQFCISVMYLSQIFAIFVCIGYICLYLSVFVDHLQNTHSFTNLRCCMGSPFYSLLQHIQ